MLGHSQWPLMALISRSTNQDDGIRDETWLPVAGCNYAASSTVIHDPDTTAAKLKVEPVVYSYQDDGADDPLWDLDGVDFGAMQDDDDEGET